MIQQLWDSVEAHVLRHRRKYTALGFVLFFLPQWIPSAAAAIEWILELLPTGPPIADFPGSISFPAIELSRWNLITTPIGAALLLLVWWETRKFNTRSASANRQELPPSSEMPQQSAVNSDDNSDIDPRITVDCRDGREAVLMLSTDRPTKLRAQNQIIAVVKGEVERGDPYPVLWRQPGTGGLTTVYQDLKPGQTVSIVLARSYSPMTYMMRTSVYLDLLGDGGLIQRIQQAWPATTAQAEVSVNIFGGKVGRLVHAHHYLLTATRDSNVVTVRPVVRPPVGADHKSHRRDSRADANRQVQLYVEIQSYELRDATKDLELEFAAEIMPGKVLIAPIHMLNRSDTTPMSLALTRVDIELANNQTITINEPGIKTRPGLIILSPEEETKGQLLVMLGELEDFPVQRIALHVFDRVSGSNVHFYIPGRYPP